MKYDLPLVEVLWIDAETTHGWELHADVDADKVPIITVGFLIKQSEHMIVIASTIDNVTSSQSNSRIKIPLGMIQKVSRLSVGYQKSKKSPALNPLCEEISDPQIVETSVPS